MVEWAHLGPLLIQVVTIRVPCMVLTPTVRVGAVGLREGHGDVVLRGVIGKVSCHGGGGIKMRGQGVGQAVVQVRVLSLPGMGGAVAVVGHLPHPTPGLAGVHAGGVWTHSHLDMTFLVFVPLSGAT